MTCSFCKGRWLARINDLFRSVYLRFDTYVFALVSKLTTHNWQKWKRVFLTCPCYEIYRVEAVDLKNFQI